ncbi:MAG TPA: cytosine permease [Pseudolysinimonas sp.]|jgi:purine-cytosine permease-like protein
MTDVPPDNGATGLPPAVPPEPPIVRRSNFAPPPLGVEPPTFDDDALAEAMAAEVRPYTQPITLPRTTVTQPPTPAPAAPPIQPSPPTAEPVAPPAASPVAETWDGRPVAAEAAAPPTSAPFDPDAPAPAAPVGEDELRRALGGASTLETIERLEKELKHLSNGEPTILPVTPTPATGMPLGGLSADPTPVAAEPEPFPAPAPAPFPAPEPTPFPAPDPEPEPALDHPAPGHFFPAAYEPIHPDAAPEPVGAADSAPTDAAPEAPLETSEPPVDTSAPPTGEAWIIPAPDATAVASPPVTAAPAPAPADPLAWLAPQPVVEDASLAAPPAFAPESPDPNSYAPYPFEIDPSLIDPVAAASVASSSDVDNVDDVESGSPETPPAVPETVSAPPETSPPAPEADEDPAAAATPVAHEPVPPAAAENPWWAAAEPVAGDWDVPPPEQAGPAPAVPVPYSTEPPVGPESPDWLDAPPPVFTPPQLIEPPTFVDSPPNAALDPFAPITANTMAGLPVPLPTEQPNIADRAELPPPPGYEDIPILSSDAIAPAPVASDVFFAPATPVGAPPTANETSTLDHDDDDVIDEVDRVTGTGAIPISSLGTVEPLAPPSQPIQTIRVGDGQPALVDEKPHEPPAFEVEAAGPEPTPLDMRAGRAARLFWLWFAANSSVLSMGLGAVLLATGMSLRQSIVATLAGVAISFLPLGLGTLAGKWSGQPTMIVSRAAFGHAGNILPALLAVLVRVLWGGVLLWLLATAVAQVLVGAGLDAGLGTTVWQLVGLVAGFVIATVIAVFGYGFVAKLQLVVSIVSGVLILGSAALTFQHLDFARALTVPDGSWILVISGAALVFSVVGLAWVHSSSDLARYQRSGSSGATSMLWATFGATLPPFFLIVWGAMLAASDPAVGTQLRNNPLAAIASLLPDWYPAPLLIAAALGLLSGAVLTMYSGGFAVQALGLRVRRNIGTLVAAILVLATAGALLFVVSDFSSLIRDLVITVAVPVAAWAGIFASEMMIRTRRFHTPSLLAPGGIYPQLRPLNFIALIVVSVIGLGLVTSTIPGLEWEGFLYGIAGVGAKDLLASSDAGVFVALLLGILVPLVGGIPSIRRQERTSVVG